MQTHLLLSHCIKYIFVQVRRAEAQPASAAVLRAVPQLRVAARGRRAARALADAAAARAPRAGAARGARPRPRRRRRLAHRRPAALDARRTRTNNGVTSLQMIRTGVFGTRLHTRHYLVPRRIDRKYLNIAFK